MIDIATVITRVKAVTGYNVEAARFREPVLVEGTPVRVYIGYGTLRSEIASTDLDFNAFNLHGEGMMQTIDVQITCPVAQFYTVFKNVYKALNGWNPVESELTRTALAYEQGGVMGLDNGNIWHLDRYRIGFSTISLDF